MLEKFSLPTGFAFILNRIYDFTGRRENIFFNPLIPSAIIDWFFTNNRAGIQKKFNIDIWWGLNLYGK